MILVFQDHPTIIVCCIWTKESSQVPKYVMDRYGYHHLPPTSSMPDNLLRRCAGLLLVVNFDDVYCKHFFGFQVKVIFANNFHKVCCKFDLRSTLLKIGHFGENSQLACPIQSDRSGTKGVSAQSFPACKQTQF